MSPQQAKTRLALAFTAAVAAIALYALIAAVLILSMSGCQAIADHNAHTRADMQAGQAAAAQGKIIAAQVREAIKGIVPAKQEVAP